MNDAYRFVRPLDEHPIPFDQQEIDELWEELNDPAKGEPPGVDEAHEEYVRTIAKHGEWHVFRPTYPFGHGDIVFWNNMSGEAFKINDEEGSWHHLVNLFAEVVDQEGDCRDAGYSDSLRQSGSVEQRCKSCGGSWTVG